MFAPSKAMAVGQVVLDQKDLLVDRHKLQVMGETTFLALARWTRLKPPG